MPKPPPAALSSVVGVIAFVAAAQARAQMRHARPLARADGTDTSYGRIEGDMSAVVGGGATVAPPGLRAAAELRLRYLNMAGLFAVYEDASLVRSSAQPERVVAGGVELLPLFFARWVNGSEWGSARADLALDSIGLELGAYVAQTNGAAFSRPGFQLGLGVEFPVLARASGPWVGLHGGVRWSEAALGGFAGASVAHRSMYLSVTLAWHHVFAAGLVDLHDRAQD